MSSSLTQPGFAEITITDLTVSVEIQSSIVNLKSPIVLIQDRANPNPVVSSSPAIVHVEPADSQYFYFTNYVTNSLVNTAVLDGNRVSADMIVYGFKSEYAKEVYSYFHTF